MASNDHTIILLNVIEVLREEGEAHAGTLEGLVAWRALNAAKDAAETWGVPLSEIGLEGYDPDELLSKKA